MGQIIKQYQIIICKLMRKNNEKQPILPLITSYRNPQRPIKDILKELRQKKSQIQQRIKTQIQQSEPQQKQESQNYTRDRVITEVPYYLSRKNYYKRSNLSQSLHQFQSPIKTHKTLSQDQPTQPTQPVKLQKKKRSSILQPIPDQQNQSDHQIDNPNQTPLKTQKQLVQQIQLILVQVPVDPRQRTQNNIQPLKQFLVENNILFSKINNIIATCLLKLNRIVWIQRHQVLYKIGQQRNAMYIILCGRMKLYNSEKSFKKICTGGESVGQQIIFSNKLKKTVLQSAKALTKCFLIEVKAENYKKMSEEMVRFGYKIIFNQMQSIIKRNYITKNWLRSQKARYDKRR